MHVFGRIDVPLMSASILHDVQTRRYNTRLACHPVVSFLTFSASSVLADFTISMAEIPEPDLVNSQSYHGSWTYHVWLDFLGACPENSWNAQRCGKRLWLHPISLKRISIGQRQPKNALAILQGSARGWLHRFPKLNLKNLSFVFESYIATASPYELNPH